MSDLDNKMVCDRLDRIGKALERCAECLETTPIPDIHLEIKKIADSLEDSILTKLEPYDGMLVVSVAKGK